MKNKATAIVFWLLIILAAACMIWGAVHIQRLDKTELAVYTQSEYDLLLEKYENANSDYSETSRQLAGYMTKYETLVNQLNAARADISRLQENNGTLTTDLESLQTESATLAQQLTDARTKASTAESSLRQMNTKHAAAMLDMGNLEKELAAANAKIEDLNTFESLAMPMGFRLPENCTAAEVGGWIYVSRRDHAAQAVIRQFESEEEMSRSAIVEYMLSLAPAGEEKLTPAVVEFTFQGGAGSRFAMQYEEADGAQMYGEFCILEIGGEYFCLEVQAAFEQRADAADMADALLEGLYARAE